MEILDTIGERIKKIRKDHGMTQQELANRLGITQSYVAQIESAKKEPNCEILLKFALIFRVSLDYVFGMIDIAKGNRTDKEFIQTTNKLSKKYLPYPEYIISGEEMEEIISKEIKKQLKKK